MSYFSKPLYAELVHKPSFFLGHAYLPTCLLLSRQLAYKQCADSADSATAQFKPVMAASGSMKAKLGGAIVYWYFFLSCGEQVFLIGSSKSEIDGSL